MRNIGFFGDSIIAELGPSSDVIMFFKCIDIFAVRAYPDKDFKLISEHLYKRYIKMEDLNNAQKKMNEIQLIFDKVSSNQVSWIEVISSSTRLNINQEKLSHIFKEYFLKFKTCVDFSIYFYSENNKYIPVRTVVSDIPEHYNDAERPLEDYDTLQGDPFWFR